MKRGVTGVVKRLATNMVDDSETIKGVFGEFKSEAEPTRARRASQVFSDAELDLLKPDYGAAIDDIKSRKRGKAWQQ